MSEESSFVAPAGLLERVRKISQIYKQTVKLLPTQQGAVVKGNKITGLKEKPTLNFVTNAGIYLIKKKQLLLVQINLLLF